MPAPLRIPHAPLTDAEWNAIQVHLQESPRGRPCDLRARFDAIFRLAATDGPWRELPAEHGIPATVARYFRRLTHTGLWERLLKALAAAPAHHPLRNLEGPICRAARRAIRLRGLSLITLARRLELKRVLPGPPWLVANPDLSKRLFALEIPVTISMNRYEHRRALTWISAMKRLLTDVGGLRTISRAMKACWI
ncbi:MAG: family transposase [Rubritepida sp.]|nr:family transposase [Rubritepida sp.]